MKTSQWLGLVLSIFLATCAWANPYEGVDWQRTERHKANLHTHTTQSDGWMSPEVVIDQYRQRGYTVLALTDHNRCTFPWQKFGRDPADLGMVAIAGNELSRHHHTGAWFVQYETPSSDLKANLAEVGDLGGLAVLYHPGRYEFEAEWYVDLLRKYAHLIGMEVYNQGDRYPKDRQLWDAVLTELMPERPVWGFSNDDMHVLLHLGRNWQVLLLPELTEQAVREAIVEGRFYFCRVTRDGEEAPEIKAISTDAETGHIAIEATGADEIIWISRGEQVHSGPVFDPRQAPNAAGYVRARLIGPNGSTYTQPFSLP